MRHELVVSSAFLCWKLYYIQFMHTFKIASIMLFYTCNGSYLVMAWAYFMYLIILEHQYLIILEPQKVTPIFS